MTLADDPTAAAVLDAVPCYPVPPSGRSPAIDALRAARAGHGFAIGSDGMMLILRRPWLRLDYRVTEGPECHAPYGEVGKDALDLLCGLIPAELLDAAVDHFHRALPNEAAAFILWHEQSGSFRIDWAQVEAATPSRLVYRPPVLGEGWHLVCDLHSHGTMPAFFSSTDNVDDAHATKIAIVAGLFDRPGGPTFTARLCAGGMFLPLPGLPFAEVAHAA